MRRWRADLHEAHGVDPGDAAPAGADLDHVDRRHRHRKTARSGESPGPRHLELVGDRHRPVADEARLRRRPPHVERQDLRQRERLRDLAPHDGAGHRPRLDEPQREVGRGLGGPETAVGQHHPQGRRVSGARESGVEVAEVVPDQWLHVGVDHRGAGALVLPDLRQHLRGGGHRDLGGELAHEPRLRAGGRSQDTVSDGEAGSCAVGARTGGARGWLMQPVSRSARWVRWVRILSMTSGVPMLARTRNVPPHTPPRSIGSRADSSCPRVPPRSGARHRPGERHGHLFGAHPGNAEGFIFLPRRLSGLARFVTLISVKINEV